MLAPFERSRAAKILTPCIDDLQEVMQNLVGIFRTEEDLQRRVGRTGKAQGARRIVCAWKARGCLIPAGIFPSDLQRMLTVSEAVTHSALARQESRGAHSRIDYPEDRRRLGQEE